MANGDTTESKHTPEKFWGFVKNNYFELTKDLLIYHLVNKQVLHK